MCQKWFEKFCAGDFSLDDAPQLGRPVEVDSDQVETLIENNQRYTMQEIADILKISKSIKLLVKIKNVSFILWKKLYGLLANLIICGACFSELSYYFEYSLCIRNITTNSMNRLNTEAEFLLEKKGADFNWLAWQSFSL